MAYDRLRIQSALIDLGRAGPFYEVTYDPDTKKPEVGSAVTPTVYVNEIAAQFTEAEVNRRSLKQDRDGWLFSLMLTFDGEALLEAFEKAWCENPPKLARDAVNGLNHNVILLLTQAAYSHPIQHDGPHGTQVTYTVEADLSPN